MSVFAKQTKENEYIFLKIEIKKATIFIPHTPPSSFKN